jgi:hypothetical protein
MSVFIFVVMVATAAAFIAVGVLAGSSRLGSGQRPFFNGLAAAIVASMVLVGAVAGNTRPCMPSLSWNIIFGQLELTALLDGWVLPILVLPAFVVAWRIGPKRDLVGGFLLLAYIAGVTSFQVAGLHDTKAAFWVASALLMASAIGFLYYKFSWMRHFGVPIGIVAGTVAGVAIFASLPFGQDNCYP